MRSDEALDWYVLEVVHTITALRSLRLMGLDVDDGRDGDLIEHIEPRKQAPEGWEVWRPMACLRKVYRPRGAKREIVSTRLESLFPGYVFARLSVDDDSPWQQILELNGVSGIIMSSGKPRPLDPSKVMELRVEIDHDGGALRIEEDGKRIGKGAQRVLFSRGERVRVVDGTFAGARADIDEDVEIAAGVKTPDPEMRVKLLLDMFGRRTPITMPLALVVPA